MGRTGQLVARGDRTWLVRVPLGCDANGRRRYHNATIHGTKRDAERYLNDALRKRDMGSLVEPSRVSVSDYLDQWIEDSAKGRVRARTLADYQALADLYVKPLVGAHRLDRLMPSHVQAMVNALSAGEPNKAEPGKWLRKPLSPKTVRHAHGVLLAALNQAMRWEMIHRNVAALVDLPKLAARELHALDADETARFRGAISGDRFEALFLLLLGTGMRPSEALGLAWEDIDLDGARATVRRVLPRHQKGGVPHFEEPKTARSRRRVPLSPSVVRALRAHRARQAKERLAAGAVYADHGLAFANMTGGPIDERNIVTRYFKPAVKRAKLEGTVRLYDLRHTHVTLSLRAGEPVHVVSARVGHASARMTLDVYAHALPSDQADAAVQLEASIFGGKSG